MTLLNVPQATMLPTPNSAVPDLMVALRLSIVGFSFVK